MSSNTATTILSIDPGFDRVGWAIGTNTNNEYQLLDCDCIQTTRSKSIFERYQEVVTDLEAVVTEYQPTEAALETVFFSKNRKTAMRVSEARGMIIGALLRHNIAIFEYNPGNIKQTVTGYGKADKQAVAKMVRMQTSLGKGKLLDDAIDAIAVGMTHVLTTRLRQTKSALEQAAAS